MHLLHFLNLPYVSADGQSLFIGLFITLLFYLNYRKLEQEMEKQEMLDAFLQ